MPQALECDSVSGMTIENPFPGMALFFEQQWKACTHRCSHLSDTMKERLPPDLVARPEASGLSLKPVTETSHRITFPRVAGGLRTYV